MAILNQFKSLIKSITGMAGIVERDEIKKKIHEKNFLFYL